jgi:hypothetical protein
MPRDMILPLSEVIGIPVADVARAEMQAAQASMEFIENVGFRRDPKADRDDFGELRFVTFRYRVADPSSMLVTREVKVPLLSLVPLPLLQVSRSEIEMVARIEDVRPTKPDSLMSPAPLAAGGKREVKTKHEFMASVDSLISSDASAAKGPPRVRVKIELKASDLPVGIHSLLRKLDQNVTDGPP